MIIKKSPKIRTIFALLGTLFVLSFLNSDNSFAASTENFQAGNIMSDYMMSNYTSMSEQEIQNFLTTKNSCPNTDYNLYLQQSSVYPNIKWHFDNGHFICLSEELFGDGETIGSGDTAAHIIWQAAQDYRINPQVLLVLLEKEQGLISDTWPNSIQYRSATGFGCPDTAPCSEKYYGFKNQIRQAANLFRTVLDGGWTNYPLGDNYIKYNPSDSCGGSVVYIENLATSALYRYTPYQPNAAALAAGYGTAPCGAYGNRNFYLYFLDNFGNPTEEQKVQPKRQFEIPTPQEALSSIRSDTPYLITSAIDNNYVLDIYGGAGENGSNIQLYSKHDGENQKFQFVFNTEHGFYEIVNPATNKSLNAFGANTDLETNVQLWERDNTCASFWKITEENGLYTIQSSCSDLVLDIYGGKAAIEKNIQLYTNHGGNNQKWKIEPLL